MMYIFQEDYQDMRILPVRYYVFFIRSSVSSYALTLLRVISGGTISLKLRFVSCMGIKLLQSSSSESFPQLHLFVVLD